MKLLILLGCITLVTALFPTLDIVSSSIENGTSSDGDVSSEWFLYVNHFNKTYSESEMETRKLIFLTTRWYVNKHNEKYRAGKVTYKACINHFSDWTLEEATASNGYFEEEISTNDLTEDPDLQQGGYDLLLNPLPDSVDWREIDGCSLNVKDQGICGACWAFSANGALEAQIAINTGETMDLSEQQLVDCSKAQQNKGCSGGQMTKAFAYIQLHKGLSLSSNYPYSGTENECKASEYNQYTGFNITEIVRLDGKKREDIKTVLANYGPICAGVDASLAEWYTYSGGVFYHEKCINTTVNHGVLLIGYGTNEKGIFYWIIKNSWGYKWGDEGYMLLFGEGNHCGIYNMLSYPKLSFYTDKTE